MKNICRTKGARKGQMPGYVKDVFWYWEMAEFCETDVKKCDLDFMRKNDASDAFHLLKWADVALGHI